MYSLLLVFKQFRCLFDFAMVLRKFCRLVINFNAKMAYAWFFLKSICIIDREA